MLVRATQSIAQASFSSAWLTQGGLGVKTAKASMNMTTNSSVSGYHVLEPFKKLSCILITHSQIVFYSHNTAYLTTLLKMIDGEFARS